MGFIVKGFFKIDTFVFLKPFYVYGSYACVVSVSSCMPDACRGQKRCHPLELELQMLARFQFGAGN